MSAGQLANAPTPTKGRHYAQLVVRAADFILRQRKFCESRSQTRAETATAAATPATADRETTAPTDSTSRPSPPAPDQPTTGVAVAFVAPRTDSAKTPEATARAEVWSIVAVFNGTPHLQMMQTAALTALRYVHTDSGRRAICDAYSYTTAQQFDIRSDLSVGFARDLLLNRSGTEV